jgi:molecular chaperone HscA
MALLEIHDPLAAPRPVGIDLGTTNSVVACVRNERPEAIADCNLAVLVPSVVEYENDGGTVVGELAAAHARSRPRDTIVSVKRFMGRGADDPETRRLGPYAFVSPEPGEPNVVRFRVAGGREVTPVEVSAEILKALKRRAEDDLGQVGGVVITVPAYFDDGQRQATKDAGRLAGLEVLRLLNEPTAAALAYGLEKKVDGHFVVYDLGGGTFDVTVLLLEDGVFQVKATGGDSALGGDDMDRLIAEDMLTSLGWSHPEPHVVRHVLDEARSIKHALTGHAVARAPLPRPSGGDGAYELTRARLDAMIQPLLERTGTACRRALKDSGLKASEIDGVILVGGATRVPAVRAYVEAVFGKPPLADIDPDQVVALGAAIQADLLAGVGRAGDVLLLDVIPLSLGIEVGGGVVDKILPRNTTVPTAARATYTTQEDRQTGFVIHVVQGEREIASDCRSLATFTLAGIPPMAAGMAKLEVTFRVDADGILAVHAKELTTGLEQVVDVKPSYGLDDAAVEKMLEDALEYGEADLARRKLAESRVEAHRIHGATRKAVEADPALLEPGERARIEAALDALAAASAGEDASAIQRAIEALDAETNGFAGRRMNRAIALAVAGKKLDEVEHDLGSARQGAEGERAAEAKEGAAAWRS